MSRRQPFWQGDVLHVPTSPFMSPVNSPLHSPLHSPSHGNQSPDHSIAAAILVSLQAGVSDLTMDDLLSTLSNGAAVEEEAEDEEIGEFPGSGESEDDPIVVDGSRGLDESIERSVRNAYEQFMHSVAETLGPETVSAPPSGIVPAVIPAAVPPSRSPPPPPPPRLRVVPLSTGGFSFEPGSPRRTQLSLMPRQRTAATLSSSRRPIIRQLNTSMNMRRRVANNRIVRFARQLRSRGAAGAAGATGAAGAAGAAGAVREFAQRHYARQPPIGSFVLTESFGIPVDKCAICIEPYKQGDRVSFVSCQPTDHSKDHLFHTQCIGSWIESLRSQRSPVLTCPVCRGVF